jgi:UTP--glucose-1-phosphate uridylyltransferase
MGPDAHPPHPGATVRKAVIPAAGMGTRFLPATKSMPKEMLPIVDRPVLQYVVEEAAASGIEDILIVTGRGKTAIENHFDDNPELEAFLMANGRASQIETVRGIGDGCRIHYIRQRRQLGLGDAVRLARWHVGGEPFAVLLGDTIIVPPRGERPGLRQLLDAHETTGGSVVAVQPVPAEWVRRYGVVDGTPLEGNPRLRRLARLVEKPEPEVAPSRLAIAGRYVFTAEIFDAIDATGPGFGGEIQLTDAMNLLAARQPFHSLEWQAHRYDIGNRLEYIRCFLDLALAREDLAAEVRVSLREALAAAEEM